MQTTSLMLSRAQIPVRKQGSVTTSSWSTRILTIDTATGTVTISRRGHPKNVLYHALDVKIVQMWPRFHTYEIDDDYQSLKAKMTLRIIGKETPVPDFAALDSDPVTIAAAAAAVAGVSSTSNTSAAHAPGQLDTRKDLPTVSEFAFTPGDAAHKSRPLLSEPCQGLYEVWLVRFTGIEAYELAVRMLGRLRSAEGDLKKVYGDHVEVDLAEVKKAWAHQ